MPSVVIAAHNEENVIGQCLDALIGQDVPEALEIVVSANGCVDRTAAIATRRGVTVIDRREPGKAGALNAGDEAASGFPRIYLDADIVVPPGGIAAVVACFEATPRPMAVVPRRRLNTAGRPWPVKAYFTINERMSAFRNGLFGRGMIVVSEEGRLRFDAFPDMIADDLFIDSQYSDAEKAEAEEVEVVVETPFTTRDLVRRLVRVRRGNAQMRAAAATGRIEMQVRPADRWSWLRDAVAPEPRLAPAAIPYLTITVIAAALARRPAKAGRDWGRDESTRGSAGPDTEGATP